MRSMWGMRVFAILVSLASLVAAAETQPAKLVAPQAKATASNSVYAEIVDNPQLPRVLLVGDSISIGYTLDVRELLKDKANVHRIPTNGGPTTNGLKNLDAWLGEGKWDVIHFNWGLHDLKYVDEQRPATDAGKRSHQVSLDHYAANLRALVKRLKQTGAKLIWCTTTPVPEGAAGRVPGDELKYNVIAARVMEEQHVAVNDLYAFAQPRLAKIQLPADVHFTPEGSRVLAGKVAESILAALGK